MGGLPSLRATGRKVWSRIQRAELQARSRDSKLQALRLEVERVTSARSAPERAAQLARVLDAVSELADAHGLSEAELSALRKRSARATLKKRASGVVAQVWGSGPVNPMNVAFRVGALSAAVPTAFAAGVLTHKLLRRKPKPARRAFVLRVGRSAAGPTRLQLVAASLLHLPRLQRQLVALRRNVRMPALPSLPVLPSMPSMPSAPISPIAREHIATAGLILRSSRSGMRLTYEVASAGAQLFLRSYVFPRVLRYLSAGLSTGVALREVATARVLPPAR